MSEYYTGTLSGKKLVGALRSSAALGAKVYPRGNDGISPVISVEDIPGGHRVTVTDAEGVKTFPVLDGRDGASGADPIVMEETGTVISVSDAAERAFHGLTIYGRTTQDSTPAPDAPVPLESVGDSVEVTAAGKNLYKCAQSTFTYNEDGSFTNVVNTGLQSGPIAQFKKKLPAGNYALSFLQGKGSMFIMRASGDYTNGLGVGGAKTFYYDGSSYLSITCSDIPANEAITYKIQLERGTAATEFEPYKERQTVTISHTLPGIPVPSGGNYTDENGQQWIADEADFARGKYVQRVGRVVLDGTDKTLIKASGVQNDTEYTYYCTGIRAANINVMPLCTHLRNGAPFSNNSVFWQSQTSILFTQMTTVAKSVGNNETAVNAWLQTNHMTALYALATPIETDLSDADIAAFAQLRSFKPNTTVFNDAGAYMAVQYVADTKSYIDQKIAEISAAVLSK